MSDKTYIGRNLARIETAPAFAPFSKVIAWYDDQHAFMAGDDSGRTLEVDLPFATQSIVDEMLERIRGYVYQPWYGHSAILDPAAELGDGVTVNNLDSILVSVETTFDALMTSEVSAPADEEVDHEYQYVTPTNRALKRKMTLGADYHGVSITQAKGLEVTQYAADGTARSRAHLNGDVFAMYDDNGTARLYFDPETGRYKFVGDLDISGGSINMSGGTINWGGNKPASGISSSEAKTIISEELVSSPTIAGAKFYSRESDGTVGGTWLELGKEGGPGAGYGLLLKSSGFVSRPVFGVYNGDYDSTAFYAKGINFLRTDITSEHPDGVALPQGAWDFSNAWLYGVAEVDSGENDLVLRSNDGQIAMRFDTHNDWISIHVAGTTFVIDSEGFRPL